MNERDYFVKPQIENAKLGPVLELEVATKETESAPQTAKTDSTLPPFSGFAHGCSVIAQSLLRLRRRQLRFHAKLGRLRFLQVL